MQPNLVFASGAVSVSFSRKSEILVVYHCSNETKNTAIDMAASKLEALEEGRAERAAMQAQNTDIDIVPAGVGMDNSATAAGMTSLHDCDTTDACSISAGVLCGTACLLCLPVVILAFFATIVAILSLLAIGVQSGAQLVCQAADPHLPFNAAIYACAANVSRCTEMRPAVQMSCIDSAAAGLPPLLGVATAAPKETALQACTNLFAALGGIGSDAMLVHVVRDLGGDAAPMLASACVARDRERLSAKAYVDSFSRWRHCYEWPAPADAWAPWTSAPNRTCTAAAARAATARALGRRWQVYIDDNDYDDNAAPLICAELARPQ